MSSLGCAPRCLFAGVVPLRGVREKARIVRCGAFSGKFGHRSLWRSREKHSQPVGVADFDHR